MARYQVTTIERPCDWTPVWPDDVPPVRGTLSEIVGQSDDLFAAVRQAIEYNEAAQQGNRPLWAVVVETDTPGKTWPAARLCTPLSYKVAAIWWPAGWEPQSPLDVPNCVWKERGDMEGERLAYPRAMAVIQGLNEQSMNQPGSRWYVLVAIENEPVSETVSYDSAGTETTVAVRRLHVIRPAEGGGRGDCRFCPAHSHACAREDWNSLEQTVASIHTRPIGRSRP